MMRTTFEPSKKLRQSLAAAALICSFVTTAVIRAAPVSVFGVGYLTPGLEGEMYRFSENGTMTQKWEILESRQAIDIATYGTNLYVAGFNGAINRYDFNGQFVGEFANVSGMAGARPNVPRLETDSTGSVYIAYGGQGSEPRTSFRLDNGGNISASFSHPDLVFPYGIDATSDGEVYIVSGAFVGMGNRLFRFDSAGGYLGDFPIPETGHPSDIAINEISKELYIADELSQAITIYDISSGAPIYLETLAAPGHTINLSIEPKSGRIFGACLVIEEDELGLYVRLSGFEVSRDGDLLNQYFENAAPQQQSVHSIVAVPVPEPTCALLLLLAAVGGSWQCSRRRQTVLNPVR